MMNNRNSAEIQQKIEDETSVGTYVSKQLSSLAWVLGGTAVGIAIGSLIHKKMSGENAIKLGDALKAYFKGDEAAINIVNKASIETSKNFLKTVGGGAMAGSMIGSYGELFGHWKNITKTQKGTEYATLNIAEERDELTQEIAENKNARDFLISKAEHHGKIMGDELVAVKG